MRSGVDPCLAGPHTAGSHTCPGCGRPVFTCPVCARTSHHPEDARQGYCGACHAFTVPLTPVFEVAPHADDELAPLGPEDLDAAQQVSLLAWRLRDGRLVAAMTRCCSTLGGHTAECAER